MEDALRSYRLPALALAFATLAIGLGACHRAAPDSPEYQDAFDLYTKIYAAKLDDAYGDPRMQQVSALLDKVDPASSRAAEAKDLKAKVDQGFADFKKRQDAVAADQKAAETPAKWPTSQGGEAPAAPPTPPPTPTNGPSLGMTRDEFLSKYGDCFALKGLYQQAAKQGEAYVVKPGCNAKYPALANSLVVLLDSRVSLLIPMSQVSTVVQDAGTPAAPEPPPPPKPEPPPPPPPPPRTSPQLPGMPRADAPPAPAPASP